MKTIAYALMDYVMPIALFIGAGHVGWLWLQQLVVAQSILLVVIVTISNRYAGGYRDANI